jgi:hypothetical protein
MSNDMNINEYFAAKIKKAREQTFTTEKAVKCQGCRQWIAAGEQAKKMLVTDHRFTVKTTRVVIRHAGTYDANTDTCR